MTDMRQLTSLDAQFLAVEDGSNHGHVMGLGIYDPSTAPSGKLTRETIRDLVLERIHFLPPLRSRLVEVPLGLDHAYWADDPDLDVDRHVIAHKLEGSTDDQGLAELVAGIVARPLDRSRPLWELHVIEGLPDKRVGVVTKLHHAAIDGVSGAELVAALLDPTPEPRSFTPEELPAESLPGRPEMLLRGVAGLPRQPLRLARSVPRALPHIDLVPNLGTLPGVPTVAGLARRANVVLSGFSDGAVLDGPTVRAPRTSFNGRITGGRRIGFASLSLTEVKAIKGRFGATVNDVVMAIVSGALRSFLIARDELPEGPLVAVVPISVRVDDGSSFGNQIGMLLPALPTDEPDPLQRLLKVHESMRSAKDRHQATPATLLQDANHFIPPAIFARAARASMLLATQSRMGVSANLLVSNVPGSPAPMYMAGARLVAQYPVSAIFHGLGLNITVLSYLDQMDWGVVCDGQRGNDAWALITAIKEAQAELVACAA